MEPTRPLPIGIQSFEVLRSQGYLYVDKTALIYRLASTYIPYFLSRPRRFGKSLLISTFAFGFERRRSHATNIRYLIPTAWHARY